MSEKYEHYLQNLSPARAKPSWETVMCMPESFEKSTGSFPMGPKSHKYPNDFVT